MSWIIQWMLLSLMFMLNLMFMFINHPLAMGMILMIQTTLISLIITLMNLTYWFSYILFIIFMGGMLVLFIYITSLASNKMFSFSMKLLILSSMNMIMFMFIMYMLDKNLLMIMMNSETHSMINKNNYMKENFLMLMLMYNYSINSTIIILVNYLLITLIAIVKITKLSKGPLRPMF